MRHRSKKKEAEYRLRRPLVARLLEERPMCEACPIWAAYDKKTTYVRNRSVDIHEVVRRSQGGSILDESNLMAVCRPCHDRIGRNETDEHGNVVPYMLGLAKYGWTLSQPVDDDPVEGI